MRTPKIITDIAFLAKTLNVPIAKITWYPDGENRRLWFFHLEDGREAILTSSALLNQSKFQLKMVGGGVLPAEVSPRRVEGNSSQADNRGGCAMEE